MGQNGTTQGAVRHPSRYTVTESVDELHMGSVSVATS